MHKKEMIKSNNEKRKELTEENREYYEDMLLYIRLSYSKSELDMEEVLAELLDHLLEAQSQGRTAEDVFGNDPKAYAEDIVGELPTMMTKEKFSLISIGILGFLGVSALFTGIGDLLAYIIMDQSEPTRTIHIGSSLLETGIFIPLAFFFTYVTIQYLRWSTFRKIKRSTEFIITFLFGGAMFLVYFFLILFLPEFGPELSIPLYVSVIVGIVLTISAWVLTKKS
ncbi:DUF1129 family protein [Salimicrobium halophilum]|uniref:Uncharacterized membrane-anchored protein n=1 Tax=Salimicrobium halophilum TaxID=86666 RepID=A0A1G8V9Y2_9BACI|nr:DUF1129 family protein [Salimicrobium halophilum]SDJ62667.1 Uncharacterized membrane-anchored protein [Salimicrobium halophilum]